MDKQKLIIRIKTPKIYSKELKITRQTASRYLKQLSAIGILEEHKIGKSKYYINTEFLGLLKKS